jgi:hypothetical protein
MHDLEAVIVSAIALAAYKTVNHSFMHTALAGITTEHLELGIGVGSSLKLTAVN